jgi:hypothetical protein
MSVVPLPDVKAHLNIQGTGDDAELQTVIDAAEARLSLELGPLSAVTVTKRVATSGSFLLLPVAPAQTLTSITDVRASTALDLSLVTLDEDAGIVYYADGLTAFLSPAYDVVYEAGWATVPADILFAIKEQVRHLWETQRGTPLTPDDTFDTPSVGYALPNRVLEMIAPYRQTVVG